MRPKPALLWSHALAGFGPEQTLQSTSGMGHVIPALEAGGSPRSSFWSHASVGIRPVADPPVLLSVDRAT